MGVSIGTVIALTKVKFFADFASFPTTGSESKLYVAQDTGRLFRWNGTAYLMISLSTSTFTIKGGFNATTGVPALSGLTDEGDTFVVTVAGTQTINGSPVDLNVGDLIIKTDTTTLVVVPLQEALFNNVTSGRIPLIQNGAAVDSSISETSTVILFDKTGRFPAGSIDVGTAVRLSENGGFLETRSAVTGNEYIIPLQLISETTDIGVTQNPFYYELATEETDFELQPDTSQQMTVTTFNFPTTVDFQLNAFTLNFVNPLTNFRYRAISTATNETIRYFPSETDYLNGVGITVTAGEFEVFRRGQSFAGRDQVPFRFISQVDTTIEYVADQAVEVLGNGTLPYFKIDRQLMTRRDMPNTTQLGVTIQDDGTPLTQNINTINFTGNITITQSTDTATIDITGASDADAIHDNVAGEINAITAKSSVNDNDLILIEDSEDTFNKKKITVSQITGGATPILPVPSVYGFSIDIAERVDVNPSPDPVNTTHTVTYSTTNYSRLTSLALQLNGTDIIQLTLPTSDGEHTEQVTLSGIDLSAETDLVFRVQGNDSVNSNTYTVQVRDVVQSELMYYGVSTTDNPDTIDVATLTSVEIEAGDVVNATFTMPDDNYAIILIPNTFTISRIEEQTFDQNIITDFTLTEDVRTIATVTYDSYVLQNESGITGDLVVEITIGS